MKNAEVDAMRRSACATRRFAGRGAMDFASAFARRATADEPRPPFYRTRRANHHFLSSPFCKNILIFRRRKSVYMLIPSCSVRGALAIVTDVEQDAVDADAPLTNGAEADGKTVWS
jgi:hypothetical protein